MDREHSVCKGPGACCVSVQTPRNFALLKHRTKPKRLSMTALEKWAGQISMICSARVFSISLQLVSNVTPLPKRAKQDSTSSLGKCTPRCFLRRLDTRWMLGVAGSHLLHRIRKLGSRARSGGTTPQSRTQSQAVQRVSPHSSDTYPGLSPATSLSLTASRDLTSSISLLEQSQLGPKPR